MADKNAELLTAVLMADKAELLKEMLNKWLPGPKGSLNWERRSCILNLFEQHIPIPKVREIMIEIIERATGEANIWDRRIVQEVFKEHGYEVSHD